ncbi:hypothetical protein [Streptomyces sp. NPDC005408]|uniref:hypothetical protein n=1 Tax=Streptomyces sp. NPDC005408 TaxID=3155341 RepID=UPI0033BDF8D3
MSTLDAFFHERDPRIGHTVRDIASKGEGELTAVVHEKVKDKSGSERYVRVAFIKSKSGIEWSTAADNVTVVP